jgi:hypothetical protein
MYPRIDLNIQMYIAMIEYVIYDTYIRYREKGHLNMAEKIYVLDFTTCICKSLWTTLESIYACNAKPSIAAHMRSLSPA